MEQRIKHALANRKVKRIRDPSRELSAVLVLIYRQEAEHFLLFTKRTQQVRDHKGQISFPGGAYQEEDGTLLNTALRECAEEIGLTPEKVEILGELDDVVTQTSSYVISPFVAIIPWPYEFEVNAAEIEEIIEVPVSVLLDRSTFHKEAENVSGGVVASGSYHYQGRVIWGATAAILRQFLDIVDFIY